MDLNHRSLTGNFELAGSPLSETDLRQQVCPGAPGFQCQQDQQGIAAMARFCLSLHVTSPALHENPPFVDQ